MENSDTLISSFIEGQVPTFVVMKPLRSNPWKARGATRGPSRHFRPVSDSMDVQPLSITSRHYPASHILSGTELRLLSASAHRIIMVPSSLGYLAT
jgi:hypothetical protein